MVRVKVDKCNGCGLCLPMCPANAFSLINGNALVNQNLCVECYSCLRQAVCPLGAIEAVPLQWPRTLRHTFSSPITLHKETRVPGRGTEEMKTNDVTGRIKSGEVGFSVDIGRPGITTTLEDVEKVTKAVAKLGVEFEALNPITFLMINKGSGELPNEVKNERVLSVVVEFKTGLDRLTEVLEALKDASMAMDTVFSLGVYCRVEEGEKIPVLPLLKQLGITPYCNGKTNVGLGRPLSPS